MKTPHFSDILFIVQAVNNRAGAKKKYSLKEGVRTNMKKGQLGLI